MPTIFDPIYVQLGTLKQKLHPYETVSDLSFLINGGICIDDCVQIVDLTLDSLKKALRFGVPRSATAIRNDIPLAATDLIQPGDEVEIIKRQLSPPRKCDEITKHASLRSRVPTTPRWDDVSRSLWVGDTQIKKLTKPAPHQELVLKVFEEEGWPSRILDPLPSGAREYTIVSLNRNHVNLGILRFGKDGTGKGITWHFVEK